MPTKTTTPKVRQTDSPLTTDPVFEKVEKPSAATRKATMKAAAAGTARRAGAKRTPQEKIADGKAKAAKQSAPGKADHVRAMFLKHPAERPSIVAKATGVDPAYVWDIRQAMRRKNLIPTVQPATDKPATAPKKRPSSSPRSYAKRVRTLEAEGLTTSDAQGVADAEAR